MTCWIDSSLSTERTSGRTTSAAFGFGGIETGRKLLGILARVAGDVRQLVDVVRPNDEGDVPHRLRRREAVNRAAADEERQLRILLGKHVECLLEIGKLGVDEEGVGAKAMDLVG